MKSKFNSERGQVLIIIALALIGLIGMVGLAVDGGMAFSDRRHAQNAADTASLAGALAIIRCPEDESCDPETDTWKIAALNLANDNGYTDDLISNDVEVYTCEEPDASCAFPYGGDSDYVQVIITSHLDTYFAKVIGIPQLHNRVEAIALADTDDTGPLFDGNSIVSLNPECPSQGSMVLGGTADISITGGSIFSNSDDSCASRNY